MNSGRLLGAAAATAVAVLLGRAGMTGHMAAHMIAVAIAAPLLALGIRGSRFDPVRVSPVLANPLTCSLIELAVVWLWHLPAARAAVGHAGPLFLVEIGSFLFVGTLLWSSVLALRTEARAAGVGALLLTSMHMTLLGALIGLAPRTLYGAMAHAAPFGLSPLEDQQVAGVVMLLVGGASYLLGGLVVLGGLLGREREPA